MEPSLNNEFIKRTMTGAILASFLFFAFFYTPPTLFSILLFIMFFYAANFELTRIISPSSKTFLPLLTFFLAIPLTYLILLNQSVHREYLFFLFLLVAIFDTGSYIIGKTMGRHKIAPQISPGKTLEGLIGGFMTLYLFSYTVLPFLSIATFNFLGFLGIFAIGFGAFLGDLFESWLKRLAGLKDSGSILPGHGGILDRIDSLVGASLAILFLRGLIL